MKTFIVIYYIIQGGVGVVTGSYENNFQSVEQCIGASNDALGVLGARVVCVEKNKKEN